MPKAAGWRSTVPSPILETDKNEIAFHYFAKLNDEAVGACFFFKKKFTDNEWGKEVVRVAQSQATNPSCLKVLFSSKFFCKIDTVAFSFVFDKNYPIMD